MKDSNKLKLIMNEAYVQYMTSNQCLIPIFNNYDDTPV